jgi:hypothetical protein
VEACTGRVSNAGKEYFGKTGASHVEITGKVKNLLQRLEESRTSAGWNLGTWYNSLGNGDPLDTQQSTPG